MPSPDPVPCDFTCTRRRFLGLGGVAAATLALPRLAPAAPAIQAKPPLFPQLAGVGDRFTFALIADSHFGPLDAGATKGSSNIANFRRMAAEINALQPAAALVVHVGDVIASPNPANLAAARTVLRELKPLTVLVHGNHDGSEPWPEFREMQQVANGTSEVRYSFNCGRWHFVTFPCNQTPGGAFEHELIAWLKADLQAHHDRPTMVLEHFHLLPQGLTQLESYTYDKPLRTRILHTLAEAGNVRWVFCGHVHNGIQAAVKTAWTWRGIHFVTSPTCVPPRNFGEEFPAFAAGQPNAKDNGGGYYLLIDVDGEKVRVRGRLGGVAEEYVFSNDFRPYENQEPLWFDNITDLPAEPALRNGSFEEGLAGWRRPYRYLADRDPGFSWEAGARQVKSGRLAARLAVREKGLPWAHDEMTELYQWIRLPAGGPAPVARASYLIEQPDKGGGAYLRITAFAQGRPRLTYLCDWGGGDRTRNMRMSLHAQFVALGEKAGPTELIALGRRHEALFWRLPATPGRWHDLRLDLASAFDQALGRPGAFRELAIDHLLLGAGVWCLEDRGSRSEAWFDDLALSAEAPTPGSPAATHDGQVLPMDGRVFTTDFGAWHADRSESQPAGKKKRKGKKA